MNLFAISVVFVPPYLHFLTQLTHLFLQEAHPYDAPKLLYVSHPGPDRLWPTASGDIVDGLSHL